MISHPLCALDSYDDEENDDARVHLSNV